MAVEDLPDIIAHGYRCKDCGKEIEDREARKQLEKREYVLCCSCMYDRVRKVQMF